MQMISLFGGDCLSGYTNDVFKYSTIHNKWKKIDTKHGPCARWGHTGVQWENYMIIYGGFAKMVVGYENLSDLWFFDLRKKNWTLILPKDKMPKPRRSHSAVIYKNSMWVYGGAPDISSDEKFWEYSILNNSWRRVETIESPGTIDSHSACIWNDYMILYGISETGNILSMFSFETMTWKNLTRDYFPKRTQHSALVFNNTMYIVGGKMFQTQLCPSEYSETLAFDLIHFQWKKLALKTELPSRHSAAAVLVGNTIYTYAGNGFGILLDNLMAWKLEYDVKEKMNLLQMLQQRSFVDMITNTSQYDEI